MATAEEFIVKLTERISGPAAQATAAMATAEAQAMAMQKAVDALSASAKAAGPALAGMKAARSGGGGGGGIGGAKAGKNYFKVLEDTGSDKAEKAFAKAAKSAAKASTDAAKDADKLISKKAALKDLLGGKLGNLANSAKEAGGPIGALAGKLEGLVSIAGKGGAVGVVLVLVAAVFAVVAALGIAAIAASKFALEMADAARSSRLLNDAAAATSKGGGKELTMVIDAIAEKSPLAKARIAEMGRQLELAGLSGRRMQVALEMIAMIESAVPGAGAKIQALAEQFQKVKRAVLTKQDLAGTGLALEDVAAQLAKTMNVSIASAKAMLQNGTASVDKVLDAMNKAIEKKFGKTVAGQLLALDTQFAKMKENIAGLFSGIDLEPFLVALKTITGLFAQNNVVGAGLKKILSGLFTGLFTATAAVMPFIKGMLIGIVIIALQIYAAFKPIGRAIAQAFGGADKVSMLKAGLIAGKAVVIALIVVFGLLAAAIAAIVTPIAMVTGFFAAFGAAVLGVVGVVVAGVYNLIDQLAAIPAGFQALGANLSAAFAAGITPEAAVAAVMAMGSAVIGALSSILQIHSPSRVMAQMGAFTGEGFSEGVDDSAPQAQDSMKALAKPPAAQKGRGGGGDGRAINFYNCTFGAVTMDTIREMMRAALDEEARGLARA